MCIPTWHELALGVAGSIILVYVINSCNTSNKGTTLHLITISLQCQVCRPISKMIHYTYEQLKPHYMLRLTNFLASNDNQHNYMLQFVVEIGSWE
jgi:hypothetical protein